MKEVFFLSILRNIFPSITLTQNQGPWQSGTLPLLSFLKYSMNFKYNEMHSEGEVFWFFYALPAIYYVKEISAKKYWCCS